MSATVGGRLWGDRLISAQRAYEIGWVNKVVPGERLMDEGALLDPDALVALALAEP